MSNKGTKGKKSAIPRTYRTPQSHNREERSIERTVRQEGKKKGATAKKTAVTPKTFVAYKAACLAVGKKILHFPCEDLVDGFHAICRSS